MIFESNDCIRWLSGADGSILCFPYCLEPLLFILTKSCRFNKQNFASNRLKTAFLSIPADFTASPQLQKVMRSAYQRPLTLAGLNSSPHKLVKAASILDLSKHRLNRLASQLIQLAATLGQKLLLHRLRWRQAIRYRLFRRR